MDERPSVSEVICVTYTARLEFPKPLPLLTFRK